MTYGVEGPCVFVLGERLWGSRGNRRHESTKERQENSVHCPTQAKTRLEWATRPTHNAAQTLMANLQQNCQAKPISSQLPYAGFQNSLRVDAPLAVQILSRPGFFPFNKFSSVPLGITAARRAFGDATDKIGSTDKRVMIVPDCHVKGLRTRSYTVATGATVHEIDGIFVRSNDTA